MPGSAERPIAETCEHGSVALKQRVAYPRPLKVGKAYGAMSAASFLLCLQSAKEREPGIERNRATLDESNKTRGRWIEARCQIVMRTKDPPDVALNSPDC